MSTFKDVYQTVTTQIIEAIENGSADFRMPWHSIGTSCEEPVNVASKRPYRGVNIIALWASALARGYGYGLWGTYKQWQGVGAQVKKGESGTCVVLWKSIEKSEGDEGEDKKKDSTLCLARGFSVFNVAQVEGYRTERRLDHAGYVKSWLEVLKQDKRAIFRAASTAQKASDWLCSQAFAIANAA